MQNFRTVGPSVQEIQPFKVGQSLQTDCGLRLSLDEVLMQLAAQLVGDAVMQDGREERRQKTTDQAVSIEC